MNKFSRKYDFRGKRVLEIRGGEAFCPEKCLEDFGAEKCACIDKVQPYQAKMWCKHYMSMKHYDKYEVAFAQASEEQDYFMYEMYGEDITEDFFAQFDVYVSLASFEHVKPLTTVLKISVVL
ncbi:hypothetical protein AGMMS49921_06380 [Endomicrobiia bacterium]|nr:hypothetical protein AGMMS49921_06380 [Endomicrobiia bacterium]